jgi:hypothetical protein
MKKILLTVALFAGVSFASKAEQLENNVPDNYLLNENITSNYHFNTLNTLIVADKPPLVMTVTLRIKVSAFGQEIEGTVSVTGTPEQIAYAVKVGMYQLKLQAYRFAQAMYE